MKCHLCEKRPATEQWGGGQTLCRPCLDRMIDMVAHGYVPNQEAVQTFFGAFAEIVGNFLEKYPVAEDGSPANDCDVCLGLPCVSPAMCAKERERSLTAYGEIPVGAEVDISASESVIDWPSGFYRSMVRIGERQVEVKCSPFSPPLLLGTWEPTDPNGQLFLRAGRVRRLA